MNRKQDLANDTIANYVK